jgi:drug/metabolite transporter (DMT)-like permease
LYTNPPSHRAAVLQALFVTFLWSTSWVIIKVGLRDIPALTFAGLRYILAFLCLLPFALRGAHINTLRQLPAADKGRLVVLGLLFITAAQGAQFLGLSYLPAITVSLLLNFSPVVVALLALVLLAEIPSRVQWVGVGLYLLGIAAYFLPSTLPGGEGFAIAVVIVGVLATAVSSVLGRHINRSGLMSPLLVTASSMGVGAVALLALGIVVQGLPPLSLENWLSIGWLAVVNTALAFPIWNHTMRTLSAVESSIINSTMLVQIAILAWLFLGESISAQQLLGMALVAGGTLLVQWRRKSPLRRSSLVKTVSENR